MKCFFQPTRRGFYQFGKFLFLIFLMRNTAVNGARYYEVSNVPRNDADHQLWSLTGRVGASDDTEELIRDQPVNSTGCAGTSVTFSVTTNAGSTYTYQWRKGTTNLADGPTGSGSTMDGATTATLTISNITSDDATANYNVIVKSAGTGFSETSENVTLTVNAPPVINANGQPASTVSCPGTAASFTVTPTSGTTPFAYQWYKGNTALSDGASGTGSAISGATTPTLTISNLSGVDNATNYNVKVMNVCSASGVRSNFVSLAAVTLPTPSTPNSPTLCAGGIARFVAKATGTPPFTYQWRNGTTVLVNGPTGNGSTITGATTDTLKIIGATAADASSSYNYITHNGCATAAFSFPATLTVNTVPSVITETVEKTACAGTTASFSVTHTGGGNANYRWRKGNATLSDATTGSGSVISGVSTSTLTISNVAVADASDNYNVIVSTGCGPDTSANLILNVDTAPLISAPPQEFTGCEGNVATFAVEASSNLPLTYHWYKGSTPLSDGDSGNGSFLSGATTATLNLLNANVADNATTYNVHVTNNCSATISNSASLSIFSAILPMSNTTSTSLVTNDSPYLYDSDCRLIALLTPFGSSPLSGSVTGKVTIDASLQTYNGRPYVQRHYDIVPAANAATSTATTHLYFTQAEFDAFNESPKVEKRLPAGPLDADGISNLRVVQFHGTGTNPGNYTGPQEIIDPEDGNITYDSVSGRWEIVFTTNGFSGFYLMTDYTSLPVTLVAFNATPLNNGSVAVTWSTSQETNNESFVIERSRDMKVFEIAGVVKELSGESHSLKNYRFIDQRAIPGTSYYRLRQIDTDGTTTTYRATSVVIRDQDYGVSPNPVINGSTITVSLDEPETALVKFYSVDGQLVPIEKRALNSRDVMLKPLARVVPGLYLVIVEERGIIRQHKVLIQ